MAEAGQLGGGLGGGGGEVEADDVTTWETAWEGKRDGWSGEGDASSLCGMKARLWMIIGMSVNASEGTCGVDSCAGGLRAGVERSSSSSSSRDAPSCSSSCSSSCAGRASSSSFALFAPSVSEIACRSTEYAAEERGGVGRLEGGSAASLGDEFAADCCGCRWRCCGCG